MNEDSKSESLAKGVKLYLDSMRKFVKDTLMKKYHDRWWKLGVMTNLDTPLKRSIKVAIRQHGGMKDTGYLEARHLAAIIREDNAFDPFFPDKGWTRNNLQTAVEAQNKAASSKVGDLEAHCVGVLLNSLENLLRYAKLPEADHIAKIIREIGPNPPIQPDPISKVTLEEKALGILAQYKNNEVMLDAFFQWATNPTSMSAGYGLEENYPCIQKNLMSRFGMSSTEANERTGELKTKCGILTNEAKLLPEKEKYIIGEVRKTLKNLLSQGDYETVRRRGVLQRLHTVSEEARKALLLFRRLEIGKEYPFQPDTQLQAHFISGRMVPEEQVWQEIVRLGAYNELWCSTVTGRISGRYLVKAIVPTGGELEALGTKLPPEPDVPSLLESYWQKAEYETLRFVDIISHSIGGVFRTYERLPEAANVEGFMGQSGEIIALSPRILNQVKQQIELVKDQRTESYRPTLECALNAVQRQTPHRELQVLGTGQGEKAWKFSTTPPLYVYLAPWFTTSSETLDTLAKTLDSDNFREKAVLFVIPCQSRQRFCAALKDSPVSLKSTSQCLLSNLQEPA
ncbi:MAG: hypothetical protein HYY29_04485, partial [Chloroflexi bacterium]|nr:hypothetical protein [Chloroflexota bacterium]